MRKTLRNQRFWLCVLLFAGLLGLALRFEHIDRYHPAPYIVVFHALTLFSWLSGLYCRRSGRWRPGDGCHWGVWVLLGALPQALMCMVSYVSWALLGASLVMGTAALIRRKK